MYTHTHVYVRPLSSYHGRSRKTRSTMDPKVINLTSCKTLDTNWYDSRSRVSFCVCARVWIQKILPDTLLPSFNSRDLRENSARTGERETRMKEESDWRPSRDSLLRRTLLHQLVRKYLDSPYRSIYRERVFRYQVNQVTS